MPHQCLKCGELFPDGSTQILRGCPECTGTRFFYTDEALPEAERESMLKTTQADVENILSDLGTAERPANVSRDKDGDWLVARADDRPKAASPSPTPAPKKGLAFGLKKRRLTRRLRDAKSTIRWDYDVAPSEPEPKAASQPAQTKPRLEPEPIDRVQPEPEASPSDWSVTKAEAEDSRRVEAVSYGEEARKAAQERPPEAPPADAQPLNPGRDEQRAPDSGAPETVRIEKPGQYDIDVKRLMEEAPIVVQKDGSYMIHLPSLFDSKDGQDGK